MPVKHQFRPVVILLLVLAAAVGFCAVWSWYGAHQPENKETAEPAEDWLPPLLFYDQMDDPVKVENFHGQVVLVNLWATWCPPCIAELSSLDLLQAKLRDQGVKVVAISLDRSSLMTIMSFLRQRHVEHLDAYWDKARQVPLKWRYAGLPASFLLDREGKIVERFAGPQEWHQGPVFDRIEKQAAEKAAGE